MNLREAVISILQNNVSFKGIRLGNVVSVDDASRTCVVNVLESETDIEDVRIHISGQSERGLYYKPTVGSLVGIYPLFAFEYAVVLYSQLDEIVLLDGSFGGLTKTKELKTQLDKTNEVVNALVTALTTWTPVPSDGGAALKAFATTQLSGKSVGDYSDIENTSINHGV